MDDFAKVSPDLQVRAADALPARYFADGAAAASAVARLTLHDDSGVPTGYGTGFLVGAGLLLTTRELLPNAVAACSAIAELGYERRSGSEGRRSATVVFELNPDEMFLEHAELGFALVSLREIATDGTTDGAALDHLEPLTLAVRANAVRSGSRLTLIEHPDGGFKQAAVRAFRVGAVSPTDAGDGGDGIYGTDAAQLDVVGPLLAGRGGGPLLSDDWSVVGLRRATLGSAARGEVKIAVTSIRAIVQALQGAAAGENASAARALERLNLGEVEPDAPASDVVELPRDLVRPAAPRPAEPVVEGASVAKAGVMPAPEKALHDQSAPDILRGVQDRSDSPAFPVDRWHYARGYEADFLVASSGVEVPLPLPLDRSDLVQVGGSSVLAYTRFSLALCRSRRMAFVAAANYDGADALQLAGGTAPWRHDARVPVALQIDNACYGHQEVDRGPLVRRSTTLWGDERIAQVSEEDTFHFTNCVPQHKNLNQRTWLELDNYVCEVARLDRLRVSIFTGPVFRSDDLWYRGEFRVPAELWKVVAWSRFGRLCAAGYVQTQKHLLPDVREAYGIYRTWRVPVAGIAEWTGLDFGPLVTADRSTLVAGQGQVSEVFDASDVQLD